MLDNETIFKFYNTPKISNEILAGCENRNVGVRLANGIVKRHYTSAELNWLKYNGKFFNLDELGRSFYQIMYNSGNPESVDPQDLSYVIANGGLEIHQEVSDRDSLDKTNVVFIDLDPIGTVDFTEVKKFTLALIKVLKQSNLIREITIRYSGNRSFHLVCSLYSKRDFSDIKPWIESIVKKFKYDNVAYFMERIREVPNYIYIDLGALSPHKMMRSTYSLHHKTGRVCIYINEEDILNFNVEDAEIQCVNS